MEYPSLPETPRRRLFDFSAVAHLGRGSDRTVQRGPAVLGFSGFSPKRVERVLQRFDYRPGDPPVLELQDVLFFPDLRCLYRADGTRIDESMVIYAEPDAPARLNAKFDAIQEATMPDRVAPPASPERVKGPVLFLGEAHDHYGHMITDTLGRMWALGHAGPGCEVLFAPDPKLRLDPAHVRLVLRAAGLGPERILRPKAPTLIERVICPLAALQVSRVYESFDRPHRVAAAALLGGRAAEGPGRPVYLSRQGLGPGLRRLEGEEELERRLEGEGWLVVRPETLSLEGQMALFDTDHPVVGAFGSALHTVMFRTRPSGQKLATLLPEQFPLPPRFVMIDVVKGSRATYVNCLTEIPAAAGSPPGRLFRIDVEGAMARLDAAGFLGPRGG